MHHRLAFVFLILTGGWATAQSRVLRLDSAFRQSHLVGLLARFDSPQAIAPAQLGTYLPQFKPVTEAVLGYGADQRHHYLMATLSNPTASPRRLVLMIEQFFYDTVAVYTYVLGGRLLTAQQSGWQVPLGQRPMAYPLHNFSINVPANQTVGLVLHTKVNARQRVSKALLTLYDETAFHVAMTHELLIQGGLYGCLGLAVVFGLIVSFYTRRWLYGLYSCYVGTQAAYALNINGLFNYLPYHPGWLSTPRFGYLMVLASVAFQGHFYLRFLRTDSLAGQWLRRLAYGITWAMTGWLLLVVFSADSVLIRHGATWLTAAHLLGMFTYLGLGVWRGQAGAIWMLSALSPVLLLVTYYLLSGWLLPLYMPAFTMPFVAPVLLTEVITLGAGLAYRFNADRRQAILRLGEVERDTTSRIMQAQEDERQQLAANLHDDLGGTLSAIRGELSRRENEANPALTPAIRLTDRAVDDLRLISHHLMPTAFTRKGLRQVLEEAVDLANRAQAQATVLLVSYGHEVRFAPDREINTYRMVRELLTNALKHAQASRITIQLIYYDTFLYASVEDDGKGLAGNAPATGIGLKNSQLRADYLQAKLTLESGPLGTLAAIEVPYEK